MNSSAALRREKLDERDDHIADLIQNGVPLTSMAVMVGAHRDYCKDHVARICQERGLTYNPTEEGEKDLPVGVTKDSWRFRHNLATRVYDARETHHYIELQTQLGLSNKAQAKASDNPYTHDWTLGQLERLSRFLGVSFTRMMLMNLLTDEEWEKVSACLSSIS